MWSCQNSQSSALPWLHTPNKCLRSVFIQRNSLSQWRWHAPWNHQCTHEQTWFRAMHGVAHTRCHLRWQWKCAANNAVRFIELAQNTWIKRILDCKEFPKKNRHYGVHERQNFRRSLRGRPQNFHWAQTLLFSESQLDICVWYRFRQWEFKILGWNEVRSLWILEIAVPNEIPSCASFFKRSQILPSSLKLEIT